jgi:DNA-binding MarR family transcriptional regulator
MSGNLTHSNNKVKPFAKQSREHFSIIPNAIFEIGLDHYARDVYVYMKRVAGESGECWKSIPTIAKQLGISGSTVKRSIKKLLERRPELSGKSLIAKVASKHPSNTYIVVDIWTENSRLMVGSHRLPSRFPQTPRPVPTDLSDRVTQTYKEDPLKKISEEDFFKKSEKTFLGNHERPSGLSRDPQFGDSAQADLSQADSYDEEELAVPDDVKSFMPPPPEILDWLVSDLKRLGDRN